MERYWLIALLVAGVLQVAGCPLPLLVESTNPGVIVTTNLGEFTVELDEEAAPDTTQAFLANVAAGFYEDTIFHRVVDASLVETGGYTTEGLVQKDTRDPIANESVGGLPNLRGSVGMARTDAPDSATSQFYVNLVDNASLDAVGDEPGYTVFGQVTEGLDVVDAIGGVAVEARDGFENVPVEDVTIQSIERVQDAGSGSAPAVRVQTTVGSFVVTLDPDAAPATVENFLQYVDDDFYAGTLFHRVVADFVIQGGGFVTGFAAKGGGTPLAAAEGSGLSNLRGTVAVPRAGLETGTTQFRVNLVDHPELDPTDAEPGAHVFGRVVAGLDVLEQIAALPTEPRDELTDVPTTDVTIQAVERIDIPTGEQELTPEGETYFSSQYYRTLSFLRDIVVQFISLGIGSLG